MAESRAFMIDVRGAFVPLDTGSLFPIEADVQVYDPEMPENVIVLGLRIVDGRPALVHFAVSPVGGWDGAPEITATAIHGLPVDELVSEAVRFVAMRVAASAPAAFRGDPSKEGALAVQSRRRRRVMTDELLSEVARVATENPSAPTRAVADQLHCSYRTAGRWVALAHERDLLAPTRQEIKSKKSQRRTK